jgi:periplasmic divalent cation tolerance protein
MSRLRALHPYEVPEILLVPVTTGWPDYLAWVAAQCAPAAST